MDISLSHQFLRASMTDIHILIPSKTRPVKPKGVGASWRGKNSPSCRNPPVGPSSLIAPSPHYSLNPPDNTSGFYSFLSLLVPSLLSNARISTRWGRGAGKPSKLWSPTIQLPSSEKQTQLSPTSFPLPMSLLEWMCPASAPAITSRTR